MTTVAQLLNQKGHNVEAISSNATVYDAIKKMADLDIGALVVIDDGRVVGVITEPWRTRYCPSGATKPRGIAWRS